MRLLLVPLLATTLAACAGPGLTVHRAVPPDGLAVGGIAVWPVRAGWEEPAWRSVELGRRQAGVVLAGGRVPVLGPGEFEVRDWPAEPFHGSDLVAAFGAESGVGPAGIVVLRLSLADRTARAAKVLRGGDGRALGAVSQEDRTIEASLEVIHPASRRRLFILEAERAVDPFAPDRPLHDPLPEATALAELLTARAMALLDELGALPAPRQRTALALAAAPLGALDVAIDGRPPLSAVLGRLDALDGEVLLDGRARMLAPAAADDQIRRLVRAREGLLVLAPGGGLRAGDRIVVAAGGPVRTVEAFDRRRRRVPSGGRLPVTVVRDGATVAVELRAD